MKYKFPEIRNIDDVLPHVANCDDFVVAERDGFTVINYNSISSDTFRPVFTETEFTKMIKIPKDWKPEVIVDHTSIIRRECRGIMFDQRTGKLIRRPFHKFFNVNEREETLASNVDLTTLHVVLEKLDGSMIAPFVTSNSSELRIGTKMGETDTAIPAREFIFARPRLKDLCWELIETGYTPIFEWMCRDNRIVIDYGQPRLVLTAVRHMTSGKYQSQLLMELLGKEFGCEVVQPIGGSANSIDRLIDNTRNEVGNEGYVVRFADGHMTKIKTDWYVAIHKAKDNLLYERLVIEMILEDKADDVKPFLVDSDRQRLDAYIDQFLHRYTQLVIKTATASFQVLSTGLSKKDFALGHAPTFGPFASIIFRHFENYKNHTRSSWQQLFQDEIKAMVLKNCNSNSRLVDFKKAAKLDMVW